MVPFGVGCSTASWFVPLHPRPPIASRWRCGRGPAVVALSVGPVWLGVLFRLYGALALVVSPLRHANASSRILISEVSGVPVHYRVLTGWVWN